MLDDAKKLVSDLAAKHGVTIDADAALELADRIVRYGVELLHARAWRDAEAKGGARADAITSAADAEEYQRR